MPFHRRGIEYYHLKLATDSTDKLIHYANQWMTASPLRRFVLSLCPFVNYEARSRAASDFLAGKLHTHLRKY